MALWKILQMLMYFKLIERGLTTSHKLENDQVWVKIFHDIVEQYPKIKQCSLRLTMTNQTWANVIPKQGFIR